ncbi:MAG: SpoIIE family protein phosphatase [Mycobacterium sp.]
MPSVPIGSFDDSIYTAESYTMPAGAQLLIYSDGAYESMNATKDNHLMSCKDFINLCATLAARPDWSLDTLLDELKAISPTGEFDDDCALVLMTFR